jgi:hypothetical protein
MKLLVVILFFAFVGLSLEKRVENPKPDTACTVIANVLADQRRIKIGMTRREVEQYFEPDGGAQFFGSTRYVSKKCQMLQVAVGYSEPSSDKRVAALNTPDDKVTEISELRIAYPAKD